MNRSRSSGPFDVGTVERVVVLPLAYGGVAPNRRKASFNGNPPRSLPFAADEALAWESPASFFAGRRLISPQRSTAASFIQYGNWVSGRHMWADVVILGESGFEAAAATANSLLSADGNRGSVGVAEWSPALITIGGETTIGLHVVCLDDATRPRLFRLLRERCDVLGQVTFGRNEYVDGKVRLAGVVVDGSWNPLQLVGQPDASVLGRASAMHIPSELLIGSSLGDRIRAVTPTAPPYPSPAVPPDRKRSSSPERQAARRSRLASIAARRASSLGLDLGRERSDGA